MLGLMAPRVYSFCHGIRATLNIDFIGLFVRPTRQTLFVRGLLPLVSYSLGLPLEAKEGQPRAKKNAARKCDELFIMPERAGKVKQLKNCGMGQFAF